VWRELSRHSHADPGVDLVLGPTTRPACDLSRGEQGEVVMPLSLFEAGAETAWLALQVDFCGLGPWPDRERFRALRRMLRVGMRLADNLMDHLDWPSIGLRHDAMLNRRLAIHVTGIGDWVDRCGMDPAAFSSLRLVERWLGLMKQLMLRESSALARSRGPFPGLGAQELVRTLAEQYGADAARTFVRQRGLRHRHLLTLSPFALFPEAGARHRLSAYLHLLPVIRRADTIALYGNGLRHGLSLGEYRRLLQMSWAIARNRS
jgi:hypothetical protein